VPIYRVGEADGLSYFTMGYIEGESLADRMQGMARLSPRESVESPAEVAARSVPPIVAASSTGTTSRRTCSSIARPVGRWSPTSALRGVAAASPSGEAAASRLGWPHDDLVARTMRELWVDPEAEEAALRGSDEASRSRIFRLRTQVGAMLDIEAAVIPLVTRVGDVPKELEVITNRLLAKDPSQRFSSAEELSEAIESSAISGSGTVAIPVQRARRRRRVGAMIRWVVAVLGGAIVATRGRSDLPKGVDSRKSILIGYFDNTTQDPSLDWLRVGGVDLLAQALGRWQDLSVIDAERLRDRSRRAEIPMGRRLSQDDVLRLARDAGVWTATLASVVRVRDSLLFTIKVSDVADRSQILGAGHGAGKGDLQAAFRTLAGQILAVSGAPTSGLAEMEPPTRSLTAYKAYIEGIRLRSRWSIDSAVTAFRRAVAEDPHFALAYYELSQALVWTERASPADVHRVRG
jgi:hypothetical protein